MKSTLCCAVLGHSVEFTLCNLVDCSTPGSYVHGDSPGKTASAGETKPSVTKLGSEGSAVRGSDVMALVSSWWGRMKGKVMWLRAQT